MKYLLSCLLFLSMTQCRDKNVAPETLQPLVGKWRLEAYEVTNNGKKEWVIAYDNQTSANYLIFRSDGAILQGNGLGICCGPNALNINGKTFEIKPQSPIPDNPGCALIDCIGCPTWKLELSDDEFILNLCSLSSKSKYVRVP